MERCIGYEGIYRVSNFGRVKSIGRQIHHYVGGFSNIKAQIMSLIIDRKGYYAIMLRKNNKSIRYMSHRLVSAAFIPNPDNKPIVNHINGIKSDNRIENLEWVTLLENSAHAWKTGLFKNRNFIGGNNPFAKKVYQFNLDREFVREWDSVADAQRSLNCHGISANCRGISKSSNGYIWSYKNKPIPDLQKTH